MSRKNVLFSSVTTILAIVISLLLAILIIFFVSEDPGAAISSLLLGPLQSKRLIGSIFTTAIPICFTGLAVCLMFQASMFNMCAEGAFFLGALTTASVSTVFPIPGVFGIVISVIAGGAVGVILCFIPAILKAMFPKRHANSVSPAPRWLTA